MDDMYTEFWRSVGQYFAESANYHRTQRRLVAAIQEARKRVRTLDEDAFMIINNINFQYLEKRQ